MFGTQGLFALLNDRFVVLGEALHLARLVEFDQVDSLEDVVHLLLVDFAEGVVPLPELGDLLVDLTSVTISLISASPTSAASLLNSTLRRTMSSVMLLCF